MHSTRLYREQHSRIVTLCQPLLAESRTGESSAFLRSALAKLAGAVKVHLRDEDNRLYPRLMAHEDVAIRELATNFQTTMGGLAADFVEYYDAWVVPGAIDAEPQRFFVATDLVLNALLHRIEREGSELYDMVDDAAR